MRSDDVARKPDFVNEGEPAASPSTPSAAADTTVDAFLGGRVEAVQPAAGHHRAGLEAVLLGAALDSRISGTVVDLGAGAGVAGFCAAARCRKARVVLVEREPELIDCARAALARPANADFADRVRLVTADISAPQSERDSSTRRSTTAARARRRRRGRRPMSLPPAASTPGSAPPPRC